MVESLLPSKKLGPNIAAKTGDTRVRILEDTRIETGFSVPTTSITSPSRSATSIMELGSMLELWEESMFESVG